MVVGTDQANLLDKGFGHISGLGLYAAKWRTEPLFGIVVTFADSYGRVSGDDPSRISMPLMNSSTSFW